MATPEKWEKRTNGSSRAGAPKRFNTPHLSRTQLIRAVIIFQIKLGLDAGRDFFLSPLSILAALWGIVRHPDNPARPLNRLMHIGRKSDHWINLFEQNSQETDTQSHETVQAGPKPRDHRSKAEGQASPQAPIVDDLIHQAEHLIRANKEKTAKKREVPET